MSLMTARHFVFNGKSSEDFGLVIGSFDGIDYNSSNGLHRSIQKDENTMVSKHVNTYGVTDDETITFTFSILNCNGKSLTQAESLQINEWLMGSTTPQYLQFSGKNTTSIAYDEYDIHFYATCTSIEDHVFSGLKGKTITFETNSSYGYMDLWKKKLISTAIQSAKSNIFNPCIGDLADYYPILKITSDSIVTVENHTINETYIFDFSQFPNETLEIDCYHMKLKVNGKIIPMSKIGWTDDDIKWFYLTSGKNEIEVIGDATFIMECEYPRKVGML